MPGAIQTKVTNRVETGVGRGDLVPSSHCRFGKFRGRGPSSQWEVGGKRGFLALKVSEKGIKCVIAHQCCY